jgi:glycosyltransferase involved in cell wall biosynthesis
MSILRQTAPPTEIVVSDDCSTDGTWETVKQLARSYDTIRPLRTPRNLGMPGNATFAVRHTTCDFIALLHHDDHYEPTLLERWHDVLARHPSAGFVFNEYFVPATQRRYGLPLPELIDGRVFLNRYLLKSWGCPVRGTAMIRRTCWMANQGMREEFELLADVDLWMRICAHWDVGFVAAPLISVHYDRPEEYPEEYQHHRFSWKRQRLLYEIHASNFLAAVDTSTLCGKTRWLWFRTRITRETVKWLLYVVARKNKEMIVRSAEGRCAYEFIVTELLRKLATLSLSTYGADPKR